MARPAARCRSPHANAAVRLPVIPTATQGNASWVSPSHWNVVGRSCTQAPSVAHRSPSRSATIVASVTTIDGMPAYATNAPFSDPSAAPTTHAAAHASQTGHPDFARIPATTPQMANDRSDRDVDLGRHDDQRHPQRDEQHRQIRQDRSFRLPGEKYRRRDAARERDDRARDRILCVHRAHSVRRAGKGLQHRASEK